MTTIPEIIELLHELEASMSDNPAPAPAPAPAAPAPAPAAPVVAAPAPDITIEVLAEAIKRKMVADAKGVFGGAASAVIGSRTMWGMLGGVGGVAAEALIHVSGLVTRFL